MYEAGTSFYKFLPVYGTRPVCEGTTTAGLRGSIYSLHLPSFVSSFLFSPLAKSGVLTCVRGTSLRASLVFLFSSLVALYVPVCMSTYIYICV